MDLDARVHELVRKLAEVRTRNPATFGSKSHGFTLGPPIAESHLRAFEDAHGVTLPADYRVFITQAGASGAGPYHGLLPLESCDLTLVDVADAPDWLARPCCFAPGMPRDADTYAAATKDAIDPFQGAIAIADQGCTYYAALVVTGPQRGRIMYLDVEGGVPYFVENEDFLSWYERWLDELLWGHEHTWFGMGMPGNEAALVEAARTASSPRRLEALQAMWRLPRLEDETAAIVTARIGDEESRVRAAALALVAKYRVQGAQLAVRAALGDANAAVRLASLLALVALDVAWHDDAKRLLRDPDPANATRALGELTRTHALSDQQLVALLDDPAEAIVAIALRALATSPAAIAVEALLQRARAGAQPDALRALLQHVRAGFVAPAPTVVAFDLAIARFDADPCSATMRAFEAFTATPDLWSRALGKMLDATRHREAFVRFDAAYILGELAGEESFEALEALEADASMPTAEGRATAWSVGANATKALGKIRSRLLVQRS